MIFETFLPALPLRDHVQAYHIRHFVFPKDADLPFKFYHGQPEECLSFYVRDAETVEYINRDLILRRPRSQLTGVHTMPVNRHRRSLFHR